MEMPSVEFEYRWNLENYNLLNSHHVSSVESPEFQIPTVTKTQWTLGFFPEIGTEKLTVFLRRSYNDSGPILVKLIYNMSIPDKDSATAHNQEIETSYFSEGTSKTSILQFKDRSNLNTLILHCKIFAKEKESNLGGKGDLEILSKDITSLFVNEYLYDIILTQYNQDFKAHKFILWARCPELLKLEKRIDDENVMVCSELRNLGKCADDKDAIDLQPNDLRSLLRDIYSGHLDSFKSDTLLCTAVQKYELNLRGKMPLISSLCVHSHVHEHSISHIWSVNFEQLELNKKMHGPLLDIKASESSLWKFSIALTNPSGYENVEIRLRCVSMETSNPVYLRYEISISEILKEKGDFYLSASHLFHAGEDYCIPLDLKVITLTNNSHKYLPNNNLSLKCILSVSDATITTSKHHSKSQSTDIIDYTNLSDDLLKLYNSQQFSDVSLVVGETTFPAHKAILSGRSPVFCRMFQANMTECLNNRVLITDAESEAIESLLEYIYTGTVKIRNFDSIMQLFAAADKYEILTLKDSCRRYLETALNFENVCEMLILADTHHDEKFKQSVQNFIYENADKIFPSGEWKMLIEKRIDLAIEIIHHLSIEYANQKRLRETSSNVSVFASSPFGIESQIERVRRKFRN